MTPEEIAQQMSDNISIDHLAGHRALRRPPQHTSTYYGDPPLSEEAGGYEPPVSTTPYKLPPIPAAVKAKLLNSRLKPVVPKPKAPPQAVQPPLPPPKAEPTIQDIHKSVQLTVPDLNL